jgi:hypothetical protein
MAKQKYNAAKLGNPVIASTVQAVWKKPFPWNFQVGVATRGLVAIVACWLLLVVVVLYSIWSFFQRDRHCQNWLSMWFTRITSWTEI